MSPFLRVPAFLLSLCFIAPAVTAAENAPAKAVAATYDFVILQSTPMKLAAAVFPNEARADEPSIGAPGELSDMQKIIEAFGGIKGAGALGIAAIVVQILLALAKMLWKPTAGWQLTLVLALSVVAGVLSAMTVGKMDFLAALTSAGVLAALQVLANQVIKKTTA